MKIESHVVFTCEHCGETFDNYYKCIEHETKCKNKNEFESVLAFDAVGNRITNLEEYIDTHLNPPPAIFVDDKEGINELWNTSWFVVYDEYNFNGPDCLIYFNHAYISYNVVSEMFDDAFDWKLEDGKKNQKF